MRREKKDSAAEMDATKQAERSQSQTVCVCDMYKFVPAFVCIDTSAVCVSVCFCARDCVRSNSFCPSLISVGS